MSISVTEEYKERYDDDNNYYDHSTNDSDGYSNHTNTSICAHWNCCLYALIFIEGAYDNRARTVYGKQL